MEWHRLNRENAAQMIDKVSVPGQSALFSAKTSDVQCKKLPFYKGFLLYKLTNYAALPSLSMTYLSDGQEFLYLDGSDSPFVNLARRNLLILNINTAFEYITFYCDNVQIDFDDFYVIPDLERVKFHSNLDETTHQAITHALSHMDIIEEAGGIFIAQGLPVYADGSLLLAEMAASVNGVVSVRSLKPLSTIM